MKYESSMVEREEENRGERPDGDESPILGRAEEAREDEVREQRPDAGDAPPRASEAPPTAGEAPPREQDFPGLGAQVAGVFTAAERAAQQMIAMGQEEVEDLRRRARAEMDSLRARRLSQAEDEARRIRAEAEAEGRGIRAAARNAVCGVEGSARRRLEHGAADARVLEERVEWARHGLRDVVARLQQISSQRGSAEGSDEPPGEERPS